MAELPEVDRFTIEEISRRWATRYGPEFSPSYIVRLAESGAFEVETEVFFDPVDEFAFRDHSIKEIALGLQEGKVRRRTEYWILREERDRFEKEHPPGRLALPVPPSVEHISPKLAKLNQAAVEFWSTADPADLSTHSTNSAVIEWLKQHGFSERLATTGATLIRPEWARIGRPQEKG